MARLVLIVFPILVVLVHGIVWEQFGDPAAWGTLVPTGVLSALPMLAIWIFERRRRHIADPTRRVATRSAATIVFLCTILLWLWPLMVIRWGIGFGSGRRWLALVLTAPVLVYPLLLLLEKLASLRIERALR